MKQISRRIQRLGQKLSNQVHSRVRGELSKSLIMKIFFLRSIMKTTLDANDMKV